MDNLNKEYFIKLYDRCYQYVLAKYGWEMESLSIEDAGYLQASRSDYRCGDSVTTWENINVEYLTDDLDALILERKKREEAELIILQEKQRKEKAVHDALLKERRRKEYLKLKEEFDNE